MVPNWQCFLGTIWDLEVACVWPRKTGASDDKPVGFNLGALPAPGKLVPATTDGTEVLHSPLCHTATASAWAVSCFCSLWVKPEHCGVRHSPGLTTDKEACPEPPSPSVSHDLETCGTWNWSKLSCSVCSIREWDRAPDARRPAVCELSGLCPTMPCVSVSISWLWRYKTALTLELISIYTERNRTVPGFQGH